LPSRAFIALGSNIEPERYLPRAAAALLALGSHLGSSNVYQNPAIAGSPQPDYLNAALLFHTDLVPLAIRDRLREIEQELGRIRTADKYAPRTIDLDLCLLEDLVLESDGLVLPDPDILSRPHLAVTLSELDPGFIHPVAGETLREIAARLRPQAQLLLRTDVDLLPRR
jgi:2-amino-4-hydroxy-6-hydroxymethyldihydropteridine diphosphokinase